MICTHFNNFRKAMPLAIGGEDRLKAGGLAVRVHAFRRVCGGCKR
ncbi:MAG: hypothetical protein ABI270_07075 [Nitrosospira sp.]